MYLVIDLKITSLFQICFKSLIKICKMWFGYSSSASSMLQICFKCGWPSPASGFNLTSAANLDIASNSCKYNTNALKKLTNFFKHASSALINYATSSSVQHHMCFKCASNMFQICFNYAPNNCKDATYATKKRQIATNILQT